MPHEFLPAAPLVNLQRRAELLTVVRRFFQERGYWEVETPILSADVVLDAWLEPFVTEYLVDAHRWTSPGQPLYLQTSPEAHMKRLLAAGATAIFQVSRVFRNGETGRRHNPEFTMLEWYRVGDDHHVQMDFVEQLVRAVFEASAAWRGPKDSPLTLTLSPAAGERGLDNPRAFERLTYDSAFERYAGKRVLECANAELRELAQRHNRMAPESLADDDRDGWLNFLLAELVEPQLGRERPTFLYDYPASQAALACTAESRPGGPLVAERFELYVNGVELCNGYHELTDADALRRRTEDQSALRAAEGLCPLPGARRLLEAMQAGLPKSSGVALGFDRLVMLALGAETLADVIAFPIDRA